LLTRTTPIQHKPQTKTRHFTPETPFSKQKAQNHKKRTISCSTKGTPQIADNHTRDVSIEQRTNRTSQSEPHVDGFKIRLLTLSAHIKSV